MDVVRGYGRAERFQFACSLNRETGEVRSVRMDPFTGGGFGNPGPGTAGANVAIQNCERAVTVRLRNDGYGRVEMGRINVDDRPGRADWIVGDAKGIGGNRSDFFNFSCSVNLRDGDIRSVDVTRR